MRHLSFLIGGIICFSFRGLLAGWYHDVAAPNFWRGETGWMRKNTLKHLLLVLFSQHFIHLLPVIACLTGLQSIQGWSTPCTGSHFIKGISNRDKQPYSQTSIHLWTEKSWKRQHVSLQWDANTDCFKYLISNWCIIFTIQVTYCGLSSTPNLIFHLIITRGSGLMINAQILRLVSWCMHVWLQQSSANAMSYSGLSLVSSLKSLPSHSWRLLSELRPSLFAPLHGAQMCLCVCKGEGETEMALSSVCLGAPSLSCHHSLVPGTRHSCRGTTQWGTFVSICLQFTVAPI